MKTKILHIGLLLTLGVFLTGAIKAQTTYELYIAGVQVNEINASDLSFIEGVTGTVTYESDTKTLTLNNATIDGKVKTYIENLKINLIGSNNINGASYTLDIYNNSTEINGTGSLTVTATNFSAIYLDNSGNLLSIKNCTVETVGGTRGINGGGYNDLTIENATVKATGPEGSIVGFKSLTLIDCYISAPAGAAFDESVNGVALSGSLVTDQVIIEPNNGIEDIEILGVSVYPNPALDFIEISIANANIKGLELQVYDMLGKLLQQQTITAQTTHLNIKNLEKGVYIVKIGNNTQRFVKR